MMIHIIFIQDLAMRIYQCTGWPESQVLNEDNVDHLGGCGEIREIAGKISSLTLVAVLIAVHSFNEKSGFANFCTLNQSDPYTLLDPSCHTYPEDDIRLGWQAETLKHEKGRRPF